MRAMHPAQDCCVERLHSKRYAIDTGGLPGANGSGRNVLGICFKGHFRAVPQCYMAANHVGEPGDSVRSQLRWRAAAEVKRRQFELRVSMPDRELPFERGQVLVHGYACANGDGKIAIDTSPRTERYVDVEVFGAHIERYVWGS